MTLYKKIVTGAAVTSTSRATTGTITIPGKKGGTLKAVTAMVYGTLTTVVNIGGKVEIENGSVDWKPFEFYTHVSTGAGANVSAQMSRLRLAVNKPLPENSIVTVYYTPDNALSQKLAISLEWETGGFAGPQTYIASGIGTAVTQTTISAAHVTVTIPAAKGGRAISVMVQHFPTIETVVDSGGVVALRCDSMDPTPYEFHTDSVSTIGTGGAELLLQKEPADFEVLGNSSFYFDFTPQDNQSQKLAGMIVWEA